MHNASYILYKRCLCIETYIKQDMLVKFNMSNHLITIFNNIAFYYPKKNGMQTTVGACSFCIHTEHIPLNKLVKNRLGTRFISRRFFVDMIFSL